MYIPSDYKKKIPLRTGYRRENKDDLNWLFFNNDLKGGIKPAADLAELYSIPKAFLISLRTVGVVADDGTGSPNIYILTSLPSGDESIPTTSSNWTPLNIIGGQVEGGISYKDNFDPNGYDGTTAVIKDSQTGVTAGDFYIVINAPDPGVNITDATIFNGEATILTNKDWVIYDGTRYRVIEQATLEELTWGAITNKPTEFNPSQHDHDGTEINVTDPIDFQIKTLQALLANVIYAGNIISTVTNATTQANKLITLGLADERFKASRHPQDLNSPSDNQYVSKAWVQNVNSLGVGKYINNEITNTTTLKEVQTANLIVNSYTLYRDSADTFLKVYKLISGTSTESLPDIVIPNDYDASTNAKYWILASSGGGGGTDLSTATTDDLAEGATNLYYTEARVSANTSVAANTAKNSYPSADATKLAGIEAGAEVNPINTDGLTEGATNLYYTEARVIADTNPNIVANSNLGATPVIDLSTGDVIKKTMNTNVTELSFSNGVEGKAYELHITVDATGGYTFNYTTANIITLGNSSNKLKIVTDANFLNKIIVQKIGSQYLVYPAIDKLLQLNDFLATYAGKANDVLTVKSTADGVDSKPSVNLDLTTIGVNSFLELEDTPNSYVGQAGTIPVVNALENGIENRNTVEINFNDAGLGSVTADTIFEITIGGSTYQLNAKKI